MSNNKYSSVEWLVSGLLEYIHEGHHPEVLELYEKAKAMHKQESINLTKHWYNQWEQGKGMIISEYYDQEFNNK